MRTHSRAWATLVLGGALSHLAGCGGDPVRPSQPALRGTVVDSTGAPVGGARIGIFYHFPGTDWPEAHSDPGLAAAPPRTALRPNIPNPFEHSTVLRFDLARATHVQLDIQDGAGRSLRRLIDAGLPAGRHQVMWDGFDESGAAVPAGAYIAQMRTGLGGSIEFHRIRLFRWILDRELHSTAPLAVTDASGRFALRVADLPIGERVVFVTDADTSLADHPVLSTLQVCAALGPGLPSACSDTTDVGDRSRDVLVTIHLPAR